MHKQLVKVKEPLSYMRQGEAPCIQVDLDDVFVTPDVADMSQPSKVSASTCQYPRLHASACAFAALRKDGPRFWRSLLTYMELYLELLEWQDGSVVTWGIDQLLFCKGQVS